MADEAPVESPLLTEDEERALVARIYAAGDPDGPPIRLKAASRDLSCKQSGPEMYRRVRYPKATEDVWPDCERLPASGIRAIERRCATYCEVPEGTLVTTYTRAVFHGSRGRCSVEFSIAYRDPTDGTTALWTIEHRTLRSRPVYELTMLDGTKLEVPRREFSK
jgi:hypothetical protein